MTPFWVLGPSKFEPCHTHIGVASGKWAVVALGHLGIPPCSGEGLPGDNSKASINLILSAKSLRSLKLGSGCDWL